MGTDVLLQHSEAAEQLVPSTALFMQNSLAIIVMEGLLDQIKLMKRQHVSALEQIDRAAKRKLPLPEGRKLPLAASKLEIVNFPANILEWAEPAQMLYMKAMVFSSPSVPVTVVALTTDPHTLAQYDGIMATLEANKGKHCAVPIVDNNSNYRQLQSKEEEEGEEGKTLA
ncbi:hypothetical protein C0992_002841 [Termitomyces sp. T32_za158]|nr:hypothetical protein C0992_002841 [Termitomyces sp. T32_za158]